jgi:hypothetical protein
VREGLLNLSMECEGLSFLARAAYATIVALTYENQTDDVSASSVCRTLGVTQDIWASALAELQEHEAVYLVVLGESEPMVCVFNAGLRLAQAVGAPGRPSPRDWQDLREDVFQRHGRACLYCSATENMAVDHIQPIALGGSNHISNLVPACRSCNSAKGDKDWSEWGPVWRKRAGR